MPPDDEGNQDRERILAMLREAFDARSFLPPDIDRISADLRAIGTARAFHILSPMLTDAAMVTRLRAAHAVLWTAPEQGRDWSSR
jgi:hypothetical protein